MRVRAITIILLMYGSVAFAEDSILPETIQRVSEEFVDDVKNDTLNSRFIINMTHLDTGEWSEGEGVTALEVVPESTLIGTVGIYLLPNTWKITLSYTGTLGENIIFPSRDIEDAENTFNSPSTTFVVNESDKGMSWFDFYMKPIETSYGNLGFGYRAIEETDDGIIEGVTTILDISDGAGGAYTTGTNPHAIRVNSKTTRQFITYHLPTTDSWYNGFGITFAHEKSNAMKAVNNDSDVVIKPDRTSDIISIGFLKTFSELKPGLSFRALTYGIASSEYKYYNYETSQNETLTRDGEQIDIDLIYLFKAKKHRQAFLSVQLMQRTEDDTSYTRDEIKVELGMMF